MDAKDYLIERIKTDANTRILVNRLDALEQEVLINIMNEYLESKVKKLNKPAVIHSGIWKCLLCGRDKFTHKTPHKCVGGYRKRNIIWQKLS